MAELLPDDEPMSSCWQQRLCSFIDGDQRARHFATLGDALEAIRQALAWPPDGSYEAIFADARKGLNEVIVRFAECDRKRYEAEREIERLSRV